MYSRVEKPKWEKAVDKEQVMEEVRGHFREKVLKVFILVYRHLGRQGRFLLLHHTLQLDIKLLCTQSDTCTGCLCLWCGLFIIRFSYWWSLGHQTVHNHSCSAFTPACCWVKRVASECTGTKWARCSLHMSQSTSNCQNPDQQHYTYSFSSPQKKK